MGNIIFIDKQRLTCGAVMKKVHFRYFHPKTGKLEGKHTFASIVKIWLNSNLFKNGK